MMISLITAWIAAGLVHGLLAGNPLGTTLNRHQ